MKTNSVMKIQAKNGKVYTRPEVVDYMLAIICDIRHQSEWSHLQILEPSCGRGAFVLPLVDALLHEKPDWNASYLLDFLRACDISQENIDFLRDKVSEKLSNAACPPERMEELLMAWFVCDDFLNHDFHQTFDVVVGNPPYIRFDDLSRKLQQEYREKFTTFSNRCDIYIPFFEKSLSLLSPTGTLAFICTNRFTRNRYGLKLRKFISESFHVSVYLNMEHTQPFIEKVSAYPAIFIIDKLKDQPTLTATVTDATHDTLEHFLPNAKSNFFNRFTSWYQNGEIWTCTNVHERMDFQRIESLYPTIEESAMNTKIGIGVASGADEVFVDAQRNAEIEADRLMPLVISEDIRNGNIVWGHHYILNPYDASNNSRMIDLAEYPKTAAYFNLHENRLKSRYCVKFHQNEWYRTLDRINHAIFHSAKILVPDIQAGGNIALDEKGEYYPHHNIYWITSSSWNLKALCVILRSSFVTNQIKRISVQMRGGNVRYQAQNLRNVHIPAWSSMSPDDIYALENIFTENNQEKIDQVVMEILSHVVTRQPRKYIQSNLF